MDVEQKQGHWMFRLGPVERWIVAVAATTLLALAVWAVRTFESRLDEQGRLLNTVVIQQAVANAQLTVIASQTAAMPALSQRVAEIQVQANRNTEDIRELRSGRYSGDN